MTFMTLVTASGAFTIGDVRVFWHCLESNWRTRFSALSHAEIMIYRMSPPDLAHFTANCLAFIHICQFASANTWGLQGSS